MRKLNKENRGQFTIIAAILIAIITLSLVISIHQINLNTQQLTYQPVQELVLGITSDLDRAVAHALSRVTQQYYPMWQSDHRASAPTDIGNDFISKWVYSVLVSYANTGLKMKLNQTDEGRTDIAWEITWGKNRGISQARVSFDLDIDAYGLKGWNGHSCKFVWLYIFPNSITRNENTTTLKFQIKHGKDSDFPVPNLTPDTIDIQTLNASEVVTIKNLIYLGDGIYQMTFTPRVDYYFQLAIETPDDNIYVSAYYEEMKMQNLYTIHLLSEEDPPATKNLGSIQLGNIIFALYPNGNTTYVDSGTYILQYYPIDGYRFSQWNTTNGIIIEDKLKNPTQVSIYNNGTIKAIYERVAPTIADVTMDSRDVENRTAHLGSMTLGSTIYSPLPKSTNVNAGEHFLQYNPEDGYFFVGWEFAGEVIPLSDTNPTKLKVNGNGTVVAVYDSEPPSYINFTIELRSLRQTMDIPPNLGKIQLGGTIFERLPISTIVKNGTYYLEYIPAQGYAFVGWDATVGIIIENQSSPVTRVKIFSDGIITAIYRGYEVFLSSYYLGGPPHNLGNIALGEKIYTLPNVTHLAQGDYSLLYTPQNSSFVFLWWRNTENVIPWNSTGNPTMLKILGDGNITAVYGSFASEWDTLFVDRDKDPILSPQLGDKSQHIPSWASTGEDKQIVVINSPPCPRIYLAELVNITAYLGIDPQWNAKEVTIEFGFNHSGKYYLLGNETFPVDEDGVYKMQITSSHAPEYPDPDNPRLVPEGSIFVLTITVTFYEPPWGTFKLYFGPKSPSCIQLL